MSSDCAVNQQEPGVSKLKSEQTEQREAVLEAKRLLYKRLKVVSRFLSGLEW